MVMSKVCDVVNANEWKERKSALTEKWPKLQWLRVTTDLHFLPGQFLPLGCDSYRL